MSIVSGQDGFYPDDIGPVSPHLEHIHADAILLGSVFDFPAQEAVTALESVPFDALTLAGEAIAVATLAHARELAQDAPHAPLSAPIVHAQLNAQGKLLDTDNGTRRIMLSIPGVREGRFHFPGLLTALKERHYRETFKAVVSTLSVVDADTISLEGLTHAISVSTEKLRGAYVGADNDTVTNIHAHRKEATA